MSTPREGAFIVSVEAGSPAWEAGLEPGMRVMSVNDTPLLDIIDWRWEADGASVTVEVAIEGEEGLFEAELEREPSQDWGLTFSDVLFDGVRTCKNGCVFCFLNMLPKGLRDSLYVRDDDYRLSFLQGNFVTLTNVDDTDLARILSYRMEPMNVSLHAIDPEVRQRLIGKHEARGREVLAALLEANIEVHAQIVLCPGLNDGVALKNTLDYVEAHPEITSLAIVPLGYTKYARFQKSYSDMPEQAQDVIKLVQPYQERSRAATGLTRFQLADEFYIAAKLELPPAETYDGYPQYYDGIGMLRSFMDEADALATARAGECQAVAEALNQRRERVFIVSGEAARGVYQHLIKAAGWQNCVSCLAIKNDYFGGNVDVTGLIAATDLFAQLPEDLSGCLVILPKLMLNHDSQTLDGAEAATILSELEVRGATAAFIPTLPAEILDYLVQTLGLNKHAA